MHINVVMSAMGMMDIVMNMMSDMEAVFYHGFKIGIVQFLDN
ncbi:hypothetical protein [Gracilimonas mengyeensis]|nr:hypothetical protein [Gracilimonas mengyeensis]